jgi:hypothetical protein
MAEHSHDPAPNESPAEPSSAEPSLRDALDAAFEEAATDEGARAPAEDGRVRDESGRFAPKTPPEGPESAPGAAKSVSQGVTAPAPRPGAPGQQGPEGGTPPPELKAPAQWKPEAREKWGTVDASVKAEINRREREFQSHLQSSAGLKDFVSAFENIVRPYEMFIRAENSNPLAAVSNLFQTAAELRVGTPQGKAMMVARLCQQYAIDLHEVDTALAQVFNIPTRGLNPDAAQALQGQGYGQQQVFRDPRVDQFMMQQAMQQQQAAEREAAEIQGQTAAFAEQHEFFFDVRDEMADMIEIAARRGIVLPVKEAYEKACAMNPEVSKILQQRNGASNPRTLTQAALRAKRAASSVKGESSPHGTAVPKNETMRGDIEAAFEQAGSSRL